MATTDHDDTIIHGLSYDPDAWLASLPTILHRPAPHTSVHALDAATFARLHQEHQTAHAPDEILFPFLHGLEGDNEAQNRFFGAHAAPPRPPRFRGLVWVAADDHDDGEDRQSSEAAEDSFGLPMDVDDDGDEPTPSHMHPVHHRVPGHRRASDAASSVISSAPSVFSRTRSTSTASSTAPTQASPPTSPKGLHPSTLSNEHDRTSPPRVIQALPHFTSTFRPEELLATDSHGHLLPHFIAPVVPPGISLRNFGIQVPIYATLSDIVVYSVRNDQAAAHALAAVFKRAVEEKAAERAARTGMKIEDGVPYHVFVLDARPEEIRQHLGYLLKRVIDEHAPHPDLDAPACILNPDMPRVEGLDTVHETLPLTYPSGLGLTVDTTTLGRPVLRANTIEFAQREKEEMRELTRASELFSVLPGVEHAPEDATHTAAATLSATCTGTHWDPLIGQIFLGNAADVPGYDASASLLDERPTLSHRSSLADDPRPGAMAPAFTPEHDEFHHGINDPHRGRGWDVCIECHDTASYPSSTHLRQAEEHLRALDAAWAAKCAREGRAASDGTLPPRPPPAPRAVVHLPFPSSPPNTVVTVGALAPLVAFLERVLAPIGTYPTASALGGLHPEAPTSAPPRSRPLKVLVYSADGYTESSVLALALLMALRGMRLPEAYLALQVEKQRSFFVYASDLAVLRRVEGRCVARERAGAKAATALGLRRGSVGAWAPIAQPTPPRAQVGVQSTSVSRATGSAFSPASAGAAEAGASTFTSTTLPLRRPRASTSPGLPSVLGDHQAWFEDPRFDGSFPSRVLPFLYLGNLNHATNAYMLHALGITHVVSVGECALVPPPGVDGTHTPTSGGPKFVQGSGPGRAGSLWIEEREGRIAVLDIQGVCDDGIDTLAPELEPACEWIDRARASGGTVLVHCRVGVSRSATLTIAYVMQHTGMSLVDAYLLVRSRRLSVLIQPNMRLLYNLLGWEVKLARERGGDVKEQLARGLTWPYLAKEVHALNEKYLS